MRLPAACRTILFLGIALSSAAVTRAQAKDHAKEEPTEYKTTIEGLVRDIACPIQNHKASATEVKLECAKECAKGGSPLIILTRSGDIYTPMSTAMPDTSQNEKLMPFLGKFVRVSGTVYTRNGTRAITIENIEEMKDVKLNTIAK
ncbi:MAG: hypothetical protein WBY66_24225 [Candidatus Acidiferrales bacterium]